MSLKRTKEWDEAVELVNTLKYARFGDKKAAKKLSEYVASGKLSIERYEDAMAEHRATLYRYEMERAKSRKRIFVFVSSFVSVVGSVLCTLACLSSFYDKPTAIVLFLIWLFASIYAVVHSNDELSGKITTLELENERLKSVNQKLEGELKNHTRN
jgi:uncharacterized membrane protein YbhN (UPF0104 family)